MAKTSQITVNSSGFTAIVAQSSCNKIRICESRDVPSWPTTDFKVARPSAGDTPLRLSAGDSYTFEAQSSHGLEGKFYAGATVGYVTTVTGSTTFDQDEN